MHGSVFSMMQHGGNRWHLAQVQGVGPGEVLDFSADLNPLGPPLSIREILESSWDEIRWYPEPSYQAFREAAASAHGILPSQILPGNGTAELIHLVSRWLKPVQALVVAPTFTEYERAVLADEGKVLHWFLREEDGFSLRGLKEWALRSGAGPARSGADTLLRQADLVFLCNPNNPTGTLYHSVELQRIVHQAEESGRWVVVDEAYMDLVEDGLRYSVVPWVKRYRKLIVLRSMTKAFTVPGLRIGYLVASEGVVERLKALQPPWTMNALAARAGTWLLQQDRFLASCRRRLATFRQSLWEGLKGMEGWKPYPSEANFFLCRVTHPDASGPRLADALKTRGILIRTCEDFSGLDPNRFVRIGVRLPAENGQLLAALRELL